MKGCTAKDIRAAVAERFKVLTALASRPSMSFETIHGLRDDIDGMGHDTWCLVFGKRGRVIGTAGFGIDGMRLVEAQVLPHGLAEMILVRQPGQMVQMPRQTWRRPIRQLFVCAFFTNTAPYRDFLPHFVDHFARYVRPKMGCPLKVGVALYGFEDRQVQAAYNLLGDGMQALLVSRHSLEEWNEWHAGNALRELARPSGCTHVLRTDGDAKTPAPTMNKLLRAWGEERSHGLWNLKENARTGPSIILAEREVFADVPYHDQWPAPLYHVGSEYLFEHARRGVVPVVHFTSLGRADHERPWRHMQTQNLPRLIEIARRGRT